MQQTAKSGPPHRVRGTKDVTGQVGYEVASRKWHLGDSNAPSRLGRARGAADQCFDGKRMIYGGFAPILDA